MDLDVDDSIVADHKYRSFLEVYCNSGGKRIKIPVVADLFETDNN